MKKLSDVKWGAFPISYFFDIDSGHDIYQRERIEGDTPYVSATANQNGIGFFVGNSNDTLESGCLSVNRNGSVGYCFYHPYKALFGNDTRKLRPHNKNKYICLFLAQSITQQRSIYGYGLKMGTGRLKRQQILVPVTPSGLPDYIFMEEYMRKVEMRLLESYKAYLDEFFRVELVTGYSVETTSWLPFSIPDLFNYVRGDQNRMNTLKEGKIPLVSAKNDNNAYKAFVAPNPNKKFDGHCITLNNDGDGGAGLAYYQPNDMYVDSHVTVLYPKYDMSKWAMIFIAMSISKQRMFFGHGHSISNPRVRVLTFMLPATPSGSPDYAYMEKCMRHIEKEKLLIYINYKFGEGLV